MFYVKSAICFNVKLALSFIICNIKRVFSPCSTSCCSCFYFGYPEDLEKTDLGFYAFKSFSCSCKKSILCTSLYYCCFDLRCIIPIFHISN